jgi:serine/threonine-protein kinase PknK
MAGGEAGDHRRAEKGGRLPWPLGAFPKTWPVRESWDTDPGHGGAFTRPPRRPSSRDAPLIGRAEERTVARGPTAEAFGEQLRDVQRMHGLPVDDMPVPIPAATIRYNPTRSLGTPSSGYPARALTPPVPATRFQSPLSTKELVDRARLIEVLRAGQSKKLTVIHGPTGFGKSTLAAQWAKQLTVEGVAVAWLTVDHDDNNVVWFLSHLIEAIRAVTPALATELGEVLEEHGDEAERYVLT